MQPKLGTISAPAQNNVSIVQFQSENDVDFTSTSSYVTNISGTDPRVDDNAQTLCFAPSAFFSMQATSPSATAMDYRTATLSTLNRGLSIDVRESAPGVWNRLLFPIGTWLLSIYQISPVSGQTLQFTGCPTATVAGSLSAGSSYSLTWTGTVVSTASLSYLTIAYSPLASSTTQYITITPIATSSNTTSMNYGNVKKIRPIAMSALMSYSATTLQNGGMVSACLVPGDTLTDNVFTNSPILGGNYQLWENLSRVPRAYNGPLKEGTYTYWRPDSDLDCYLRSPDEMNAYNYPSIVISGEFSPATTLSGLVEVGRLEVVTVYEWTTTSTLFESFTRVGSHSVMDAVNNAVAPYPTSMSNPIHLADVKRYFQNAVKWIGQNKSWIVPAVTSISALI